MLTQPKRRPGAIGLRDWVAQTLSAGLQSSFRPYLTADRTRGSRQTQWKPVMPSTSGGCANGLSHSERLIGKAHTSAHVCG